MKGFLFFLIGGGNPANAIAQVARGEIPSTPPWVLEIVAALARWSTCEGGLEVLVRWAAIERLNAGSFGRASFPAELVLRGSGRWFAQDAGGHYALLRNRLTRWIDLSPGLRRDFERAAEVVPLPADFGPWVAEAERRREDAHQQRVLDLGRFCSRVEGGGVLGEDAAEEVLALCEREHERGLAWALGTRDRSPDEQAWLVREAQAFLARHPAARVAWAEEEFLASDAG